MLKVVQAPNEVLSSVAKEVRMKKNSAVPLEKGVLTLIEEMKEALSAATDPQGVGLAAPQLGKSLRIFIAKPTINAKTLVCINPVITTLGEKTSKKKRKNDALEGCLSLQDIWGEVERATELTFTYTDEKGKEHKRNATGFMARIVQHEVDHLDGILFPKRVLEQKGKLFKSRKNAKGETVFDEIDI